MHTTFLGVLSILAAKATTATTAASKKTTGSTDSLLIYLIPLLIIAYLLILRPQRKRQQAARMGVSAIVEGDTVATIGGIVGTVISIDAERAVLQVGPDMEMEFLRQAVARKLDPVIHNGPSADDEAAEQDDEDRGWHGYHPDDDDHEDDYTDESDTDESDTDESDTDESDTDESDTDESDGVLTTEAGHLGTDGEENLDPDDQLAPDAASHNGATPVGGTPRASVPPLPPAQRPSPAKPARRAKPARGPRSTTPASSPKPANLGAVFGVPAQPSSPSDGNSSSPTDSTESSAE